MTDPASFILDRDTALQGVGKLPSLPAVVVELLESMDDDGAGMQQLAAKLSRDQALVAKVLRVANSSFYGLQGKVDSIADAVVVLGLRGVRTLATAAAVTNVFASTTSDDYDFRLFWRHSIATALCAREIAIALRLNEGNAFTAGLLHDIGRLALASCFPRHFAAVIACRKAGDITWRQAEQQVLGLDHAELGQMLTERWRFPVAMSSAIGAHHTPAHAGDPLVAVLHVADVLAHALDLAGDTSGQVPPIDQSAWELLDMSENRWHELFARVESQFASACETLVS